jgi:ribonuclease-3
MPDIAVLQETLGIKLENRRFLEQALVHSSVLNEHPALPSGHNERLEFLGDAVLDCIVADKLYRDHPDLNEGEMTKLRATLVRRDTLAGIARNIKLGDYLTIGKGEESTGGRDKAPNLAGALEAVIAAVYLDRGWAETAAMVNRLLTPFWTQALGHGAVVDYKSKLQELTQSRFQLTPFYRLIAETGPEHARTFSVEVAAGSRVLGKGSGKSKKLAETEAARQALEQLQGDFTG